MRNLQLVTLNKIYHTAFTLKNVVCRTDLIAAPRLVPDAQVYPGIILYCGNVFCSGRIHTQDIRNIADRKAAL